MAKKTKAVSPAQLEEPKVGRPTKYKQEFCQLLIDHMSTGLSFESFAAEIGVNRDSLYEWESVHAEFSDAKKEGISKNLLFWEKQGIAGLWGNKENSFNSTVWIFNMKNRHKWRDKQPDEVDVIVNNLTSLEDEVLDAKIAEKMKKLKGDK